mmetsp:Transcript_4370/g.16668  ORF Transcript_4370/g.16668 Transcript_4370/m.16668 type:complete len:315 (-) Transcript_4370:1020-1964(-)
MRRAIAIHRGVTLIEGSSNAILPTQSNVRVGADRGIFAFARPPRDVIFPSLFAWVHEKRRKSERFGGRPIDLPCAYLSIGLHSASTRFEHRLDVWMKHKISVLGRRSDGVANLLQRINRHPGARRRHASFATGYACRDRSRRREPRFGSSNEVLVRGTFRGELLLHPSTQVVELILAQDALRHARVGVILRHSRGGFNSSRHERKCDGWIIELVVTESTVAHVVDDDVGLKFSSIVRSQAHGGDDGVRVVAVDVNDRRAVGFRDVTRVWTRARASRHSGETDLVVHHHVHRAPGGVIGQVLQLHHLAVLSEPTK